jgi:hypothetical protein
MRARAAFVEAGRGGFSSQYKGFSSKGFSIKGSREVLK